jgi:YHS domain-containing protein
MAEMARRLKRFDAVAGEWVERLVIPKLQTLAGMLPNAMPLARAGVAHQAVLAFRQTDDFPADVHVEVGVTPDPGIERARVVFVASIIPILMDYEREGVFECGLEAPDAEGVAAFLDQRIVLFVEDYLRIQDPATPYQRDRLVTDPVCGMTLRRAEAAASMEHDGRPYYFCVPECRDRFEADPERYLRRSQVRARSRPGA